MNHLPLLLTAALSAGATWVAASDAAAPALSPAGGEVAPGLVRWHTDFDAACAASRVSGKPVLLFQLLGRLDDEFC